mgnify:CR=1 FL=1
MKKYLLAVCIYMLVFTGFSILVADEPWIDYDDISKIELGSNKEDIISSLGEPILVLGSSEYDNTIYLFYNYHVKRYLTKNNERDSQSERNTLIKFTFENDKLKSWEEDNITLNMAHQTRPGTVLIKYVNLLINLILLVAVFGG